MDFWSLTHTCVCVMQSDYTFRTNKFLLPFICSTLMFFAAVFILFFHGRVIHFLFTFAYFFYLIWHYSTIRKKVDKFLFVCLRINLGCRAIRCGIPRPRQRQIRSQRGRPSRRAPVGAGGRARSGPARPLGGDSPRVGRRRATRGSCGWWSRQIRLGSRAHDCRWISRDRRPQVDLPRVLRQTPLALCVASNLVAQFFCCIFVSLFLFCIMKIRISSTINHMINYYFAPLISTI